MSETTQTRWLRVLAIIPTTAMIFMDQTILPVALPAIERDFGASATSLQWTVNSYLLAWTVFVLLGGKIGDRIGHKKIYIWGTIFFALFSVLCSLSTNVEFLVAARALQGIAGAVIVPAQSALISVHFPARARGRASGIIVSVGSLFLILGPMLGGMLTTWLSWQWIFWINLPIAILGIIMIQTLLPPSVKKTGKIDWLGFVFFAFFASFATIYFMQATSWGFVDQKSVFCAIFAAISLILALRREKKTAHPFLELNLFKNPTFTAINITISITAFILMITVFRTIYTVKILGYSPINTGFIISLTSLPTFFFSYIGGFLSDKISPKLPIALGYFCLIISFFWLGVTPTPSLIMYLLPLFLFGMGLPLIFTPSYSMAMTALPKEKLGIGFGIVSMLRSFAGTMGLALIFAYTEFNQKIKTLKIGAQLAEISSFSSIHFILGALMIIALIASIILHKRKSAHQLPDAPAEGWD